MVKVTPLDRAKRNYEGAISQAEARYKESVATTSGVIAAAIAAQPLWVAKVTSAEAQARRVQNLGKVSDEEWRRKTLNVGGARIGQGMRAASGDWSEGFSPYAGTLSALDLPAKTTDPIANVERVRAVVAAMVAKKKEIG